MAEPANRQLTKKLVLSLLSTDEYGNQIKMPLVITNSVGSEVNVW